MSLKRFLASSLLSVAVLFSMASTASAIIYTYAGNSFGPCAGTLCPATALSSVVTLSITLAPNLTDFDAAPFITAVNSTDGVRTITEGTGFSFAEFRVSTDGSGDIVGWASEFLWDAGDNGFMSCKDVSSASGGNCGVFINDLDRTISYDTQPTSFASVNSKPGTWETVVPEPNTALMIAMGLAGLGWRGRAKQA